MYYLNSRYYSPELARFISSDGLLGAFGNVLSTNMYAYCFNNPIMMIDLSGYAPSWWNPFTWSHEAKIIVGAAFNVAGLVATMYKYIKWVDYSEQKSCKGDYRH